MIRDVNQMTPKTLYAIDPGKNGAIAVFDHGELAGMSECTPVQLYLCLALDHLFEREAHVVIERVQGLPGQSGPAMFNFGQGYGELLGVCRAMGVTPSLVTPAVWKGALGLRREFGETTARFKGRSLEKARGLWPMAPYFKRAKDDGEAEAALIGHYALTQGAFA